MNKFISTLTIILIVITTFGCSNGAYSYDKAVKRGDVVYQSKVDNLDRFEQFLINLSDKKKDKIRVTEYTLEGDPIYHDLQFDGKVIRYIYDNSNDEYGGNDKGIKRDLCTGIIKKENEQGYVEFIISGCSNENDRILLRVEKDALKDN
ncbi:DUF4362 domain-containing protein [Falsibacillus albus]|uniref:DUF4362 domain-containing protein n=1 Tax=Falsibacillus albus TaxID=2478915 RepID=UPI0013145EF6|nr:DUF4362 domain-containing protein [Falsibacillus albus]